MCVPTVVYRFSVNEVETSQILGGDSILKTLGKNRSGEVVKEAFSSGIETTFLCEQITNGVTSFGLLLSQRRSQRRPKQKRDHSTECLHESQK
eukprot:UN21769